MPIQGKPVTRCCRDEHSGRVKVISLSAKQQDTIPNGWNFSRFLDNLIDLGEQQGLISGMIKTLREQLMHELPDFGQHLGYDGKAIESHSTGRDCLSVARTSAQIADLIVVS